MEFYANLHMHSTHSDGTYTPRKLAELTKQEGYGAMAITDHDTATAFPELKAACSELGLECIFGVEFSTLLHPKLEYDPHLVGFHFDPEYPAMKEYLWQLGENERHTTEVIFHEGVAAGTLKGITWDEVLEYNKGIHWLCQDHVFRAMLNKGIVTYADYPAFSKANFYDHWKRVPHIYKFKEIEEIIELVHAAGGIILGAHTAPRVIEDLYKMGIDGFEVWHINMRPESIETIWKFCLDKGLYISGGSDHSGLCGGSYEYVDDPKTSKYWKEPRSCGTTKEYFDEIKNMKINR